MSHTQDAGDGSPLDLRTHALEMTLGALENERDRMIAKYDRRIAQAREALESAEAAHATDETPAQPAPKPAPKRRSRASARRPKGSADQ